MCLKLIIICFKMKNRISYKLNKLFIIHKWYSIDREYKTIYVIYNNVYNWFVYLHKVIGIA